MRYGTIRQIASFQFTSAIHTTIMSNDILIIYNINIIRRMSPPPLVLYEITVQKPPTSFIVPPTDVQIIIDKITSDMAKNGRDFEMIVKNKYDVRFNFLKLSRSISIARIN